MRFIDKISQERSQNGAKITADYLISCWGQGSESFLDIDYDGSFKSSGTYDKMVDFLCRHVQDCLCCYCMRRLDNPDVITLEHIIPHKADDNAFEKYFQLGYKGLDTTHISPLKSFIANRHTPNVAVPHPHNVAYHNFAASCDGSFLPDIPGGGKCCNLARGNSFINPLFLSPEVVSRIKYTEEGMAVPVYDNDEAAQGFIMTAKLNAKRLKEIRYIWCQLSSFSKEEIFAINSDKNRIFILSTVLFEDISKSEQYLSILQNYSKPAYWQTLLTYDWFYDYYKNCRKNKNLRIVGGEE